MDMDSDEVKSVILPDKREVYLSYDVDGDAFISVLSKGEIELEIDIEPECGYGGGQLMLSPSASYLLHAYYSGQSEELFTLYQIDAGFAPILESWVDGEAADYCFSIDEKLLVQCLPSSCTDWWEIWNDDPEYNDDFRKKDKNGKEFFDFGCINIWDIKRDIKSTHPIRLYVPEGWQPAQSEDEYDPFMHPQLIGETLHVTMPWGKETFTLPLKKTIDITLK